MELPEKLYEKIETLSEEGNLFLMMIVLRRLLINGCKRLTTFRHRRAIGKRLIGFVPQLVMRTIN